MSQAYALPRRRVRRRHFRPPSGREITWLLLMGYTMIGIARAAFDIAEHRNVVTAIAESFVIAVDAYLFTYCRVLYRFTKMARERGLPIPPVPAWQWAAVAALWATTGLGW